MWDQGSEGWDQGSEGWDLGSEGWDQGSEGWDQGSEGWDQGSQAMRSGPAVSLGIRDQAVPFLKEQGPNHVTLLESRIRNKGTKMGTAMKKKKPASLRPWLLHWKCVSSFYGFCYSFAVCTNSYIRQSSVDSHLNHQSDEFETAADVMFFPGYVHRFRLKSLICF